MPIPEDIAHIALQERELQFPSFDETVAWNLGSRLRDMAVERGHSLVIDVRRFGQQLFYAALPGTIPDHAEWVRRKINVVQRFYRSSYAVGLDLQSRNTSLLERQGLPLTEFMTHGGCFPIRVTGAGILGTVTISGLPQRGDHELAVEAICAELRLDYARFRLPSDA
jgi:uncharacterized protein (UPF0303 family)